MLQDTCYRIGSVNVASAKSVLNRIVRKAEEQATEAYTEKLRSHALTYGWPQNLVSQMRMDYANGYHSIKYPQTIEEQILTLEYGTQNVPPMPAMRTFMLGM